MARLNDLPDELIELITGFLPSGSVATLGKTWRKYCKVTKNSKSRSVLTHHIRRRVGKMFVMRNRG